jgi:hypothetical protein
VVLPASHRVSRVPWYSRTNPPRVPAVVYRALTVSGHAFQQCSTSTHLAHSGGVAPCNARLAVQPQQHSGQGDRWVLVWFGLLPVRSPLLGESFLFLALLRCFSSGGALPRAYGFSTGCHPLPDGGLPHSEIVGSRPGSGSPTLIAAAHVLLRHSTPRHPPHAYVSFFFYPPSLHALLIPPPMSEAQRAVHAARSPSPSFPGQLGKTEERLR